MDYSILTVSSFRNVFQGNYSVKGVTRTRDINANTNKLEADSYLDKTSLSNEDIIAHLQGKKSIGMAPITEKGQVFFAVIDIDTYDVSIHNYISTIYTFGIPLIPFFSKSKGLHAYIFFSQGVTPSEAIDLLIRIRILLGLPKDTEIFPKQRTVEKGSFASWINLPYFDASNPDNPRKLIREDFTLAPLEEALKICEASSRTIKDYNDVLDNLPFNDAPPCLQTIYLTRTTNFRNEYLFSMGVYCKQKYEDNYEQELLAINAKLFEPLEEAELQKTVLKSLAKKDFSYKCNTPPCNLLCNKATCRERKHGIEGSSTTVLSYEQLVQYETDPPYYEWYINGIALKFFKESDIIMQQAFRELAFRKLHVLPPKLSDAKWTRIINNALVNIEVKTVEKESDVSTGGVWFEHVTTFFTNRVPASNKKQIKVDRVYQDDILGAYIFKGNALLEYLRKSKSFRQYSDVEIQSKLKDLGASQIVYDLDDGSSLKLWAMPYASIPSRKNQNLDDIDIDFFDNEQEGEKF